MLFYQHNCGMCVHWYNIHVVNCGICVHKCGVYVVVKKSRNLVVEKALSFAELQMWDIRYG